MKPAKPVTLEKAIDERAAPAGGGATGRDRPPPDRDRPEARGPLPPCLDPCRRRGDRRPAARPAGAALPRPALRHAGHPVQHEMGRAGRPGQVRLSRPEDPDRDRERRRAADRARACRARHRHHPARRSGSVPHARRRRHGRGVPAGKLRHARCAAQAESDCIEDIIAWSRSIVPVRWTTSRSSSPSRTARSSRLSCTPRSSRSSRRPMASSSTRSR